MVKVYFEYPNNPDFAELVAIFNDEYTYNLCIESLEAEAKKQGQILTESVEQEDINNLNL